MADELTPKDPSPEPAPEPEGTPVAEAPSGAPDAPDAPDAPAAPTGRRQGDAAQDAFDEDFFQKWREQELDPELVALAESRAQGSVLRPILMVAAIAFGATILSDWKEEVAYFFHDRTPVALGNATEDFPSRVSAEPGWQPPLVHNSFVALQGIPSRRSQSEKTRYFKLVGAEIYVEEPREDAGDTTLERELKRDNSRQDPARADRTVFSGQGRLIAFAHLPPRYQGIRDYYKSRYNTRFCEEYTPRELQALERRREDTVRANWKNAWEAASPEQRLEQKISPEPTDQELAEVLGTEPLCAQAWLLQAGTTPNRHWWHLAVSALIALSMLVNTALIARWLARLLRRPS